MGPLTRLESMVVMGCSRSTLVAKHLVLSQTTKNGTRQAMQATSVTPTATQTPNDPRPSDTRLTNTPNSNEAIYVTATFIISVTSAFLFYFLFSPNTVIFTLVISKIFEVFIVLLRTRDD